MCRFDIFKDVLAQPMVAAKEPFAVPKVVNGSKHSSLMEGASYLKRWFYSQGGI